MTAPEQHHPGASDYTTVTAYRDPDSRDTEDGELANAEAMRVDEQDVAEESSTKEAARETSELKNPTKFTDLPAEIRNDIYALALILPKGQYVEVQQSIRRQRISPLTGDPLPGTLNPLTHPPARYDFPKHLAVMARPFPALLHATRQVRSEAFPIYLGNNTFSSVYFSEGLYKITKPARSWLGLLSQKQIGQIRKLAIRVDERVLARIVQQQYKNYHPKRALVPEKTDGEIVQVRCLRGIRMARDQLKTILIDQQYPYWDDGTVIKDSGIEEVETIE